MKRRILLIAAVALLILSMSAQAVESRVAGGVPDLCFNGTTAKCSVTCKGEYPTDDVSVKLTLYQGNTFVQSWSGSGIYRVPVYGECTVKSGKPYKLVMTWSINGVSQPSVSVSATCP